jgi:carbamoyltransferase
VGSVLGISGFYHDSAAALVRDGEIVAAAQEERFSRKKHDARFPAAAINYCLEEAFLEPSDLDAIVFYDNPLLTLDRAFVSCMQAGAKAKAQFAKGAESLLGTRVWVEDFVRRELGTLGKQDHLYYSQHHLSHAASAFLPSPFQEAAILTMDGVGEWETTTLGVGRDTRVELLAAIEYPHSLGLLYSAFTYFCGFRVNSGEYKLMGLAPYGSPRFAQVILDHLIDLKADGSYRLNTHYFGYLEGLVMTNDHFASLFGGPPRAPESPITTREMDLAASIQSVTEEAMLRLARHARKETGLSRLCLAGGVSLNCVGNGKILAAGIFDDLWIQPAAGDAGGALGAALLGAHAILGEPRRVRSDGRDAQRGSLLGPSYSQSEVQAFLNRHSYPHELLSDAETRSQRIAESLAAGKVVGHLAGRMEFGPRALGSRSILGDPRDERTQSLMNLRIKYRESFRPFAPACLVEDAPEYFDLAGESPYMLLVAPVRAERHVDEGGVAAHGEDLIKIVNMKRSDVPAVTHVDYSARVQTVHSEDNPWFHMLISAFKTKTGCSLLVNTSFNVRGEPIVCSPADAYRCFMRTDMDVLVLEDCVLFKERQPPFVEEGDWRDEYELD